MLKKILGLLLAVIIAVCPVASFAEGESATTLPAENFDDGIISSWTADGGNVAFSSDDYGYLKFTANEQGAVLSRDLGIESGDFTVDFKIKAESEAGTATVSVGGAELELDLDAKTLAGKGFISELWYSVRVASDGATADVYLDGAAVSTGTEITFDDSFEITADPAIVIGIDDFKVYAEKLEGNSGMTAEVLNLAFEEFNYENGSKEIENLKAHYNEATVNGGNAFVIGTESNGMDVHAVTGKFGKSINESSLALTHSATSSSKPAGIFDLAFGDDSHLYAEGDTQVLSFNIAVDEDKNREFRIRYYSWYKEGESYYRGNKSAVGTSTSVSAGGTDGWLLAMTNDKLFVFGDDNVRSYSIIPAIMPNQWNNVRLEVTTGSDDGENAFTYNVYINDIAVAENVAVANDIYYVRNSSNKDAKRGAFYGFNRLSFECQTAARGGNTTTGGWHLDDIKLENYYNASAPAKAESPLLVGNNVLPGTNTDISGVAFDNWDYDKWVTGPVVYVDPAMTIGEYKAHLDKIGKNQGVTFRDVNGNEITDASTAIGNLTYAEIVKTNYEKMYVSIVGETKVLKSHSDDVSSIGSSSAVGSFYSGGVSLAETEAEGGRTTGDKSADMTATAAGSDATVRYALRSRDSATYATSSFDAYRPVTFETSVLMPEEEDGYVQVAGRYFDALQNTANNITTSSGVQNTFAYLEGGIITIGQRVSATDSNSDVKIIGTYNPGEWVNISVTFYPGANINRVDIRVNGEPARIQQFADDETYAAAKEVANSGDLRQFERKNMNVYSKALKLKNTANYKLQSMEEFIIYYAGRTSAKSITTSSIGLDDLSASWGYYKKALPTLESIDKGVIDKLSSDTFLAASDATETSINGALNVTGTARIYKDDSYAEEVNGNVATNNKLVVQNGAILKYFTINAEDFVREGNTVKALARNAGDKLYFGLYTDEAATTLDSIASATADEKGIFSATISNPETYGAIKGFLWNSMLVPYIPAKVVE